MKSLSAVLVCALAFSVSACAPVTQSHGQDWSVTHVLRIGVTDEPDSLNPLFSHTIVADDITALLFAPLFRYDQQGEYLPELADRVPTRENGDISVDGRSVTLRLRPNLVWQDGAPLTVHDLVFTWHAVMNPRNATKLRAGWSNIQDIETPNTRTATIRLARPDATFLSLFAGGGDAAYPLLPAHLLEKLSDVNRAAWNALPVGSGPWKLARWNHGSDLSFLPNEHYWRGKPQLQGLRLTILPDSQTLITALRAHEIDAVGNVPSDQLAELKTLPGLHLITKATAAYRHLDLNTQDAVLADVRVRRAVVQGIRWSEILHVVYHDEGVLAQSDIFPTSWAASVIPAYEYNPSAAKHLLDAAGWHTLPDGTRTHNGSTLRLTLMSGNANSLSQRAETLMAHDLSQIGIGVEIKNAPADYLFAENGPLYTGHYQLAWMSDTRAPDPDNASSWSSMAIPPNGANTVFLRDAQIDHLTQTAHNTPVRSERKRLYALEELRLHELVPSLIFAWQKSTFASWGVVQGLEPATYYSSFENSWQWHS